MYAASDRPAVQTKAPIRALKADHRPAIQQHLLALGEHDRYLRFGYQASDAQIERYVSGLDFGRDEIFGVFDDELQLMAVAHLGYMDFLDGSRKAEFGVSVSASARGQGMGRQLFARAVMHARNHGVSTLFVHALSENVAMLKIACKAGATVVRDGSESEAYLDLPPADLETHWAELLEEQRALNDYHLKAQMNVWREVLDLFDSIRNGSVAKA